MRTVTGNIVNGKGDPYAEKHIFFTLCDRYGNKKNRLDRTPAEPQPEGCHRGTDYTTKIARDVRDETSTDVNGAFSVVLAVTECDNLGDYYLMEFEETSGLHPIKLYVRAGEGSVDYEKLTVPYVSDKALSEYICNGKLNPNARRVLDRYMSGEIIHNANEQRMITNFLNFAAGYNDKEEMKRVDNEVLNVN